VESYFPVCTVYETTGARIIVDANNLTVNKQVGRVAWFKNHIIQMKISRTDRFG
jgi:hypothetical protein